MEFSGTRTYGYCIFLNHPWSLVSVRLQHIEGWPLSVRSAQSSQEIERSKNWRIGTQSGLSIS